MISQDLKLLVTIFAFVFMVYYGTHRTVMNRYKGYVPNLQ